MRAAISFILAFAMAALPAAAQDISPLNPPVDLIQSRSFSPSVDGAKPVVGRMTNAKRLSMNLPPLKPKALQRGTRSETAPRSGTSMSPPVPHGCNILVKNVDGSVYGYLAPAWNAFGEYGPVQAAQAGSLEVTFNVSPDDPSPDEVEIHADNGPNTKYPFFGATVGYSSNSDNLGTGSFNYAFATGTTQIPAGSTPTSGDNNSFYAVTAIPRSAEGAIWKYDPVTHEITAQWINTDGSRPNTYLVWSSDSSSGLILTGDIGAFQNTFGASHSAVTLTCVPPPVTQPLRE